MNAELVFTMDASLESVVKAAGLSLEGRFFEHCALQVGDFISFPEAPTLFFRVAKRWLRAGSVSSLDPASWPEQWVLVLEQSEAPFQRSVLPQG